MEQKILARLKLGPATVSDIHKVFSGHASGERLQTALGNLEAANKIRVDILPGKGRPRKVLTLRDTGIE